MPKWLAQTLCDNNLATPLFTHTCSRSQQASFENDYYACFSLNMCDQNEPISFDEA